MPAPDRLPADLRVPMTSEERAELTELFADELARGWIPTRHDLEDALGTIRARRRGTTGD
ncbi:hypothetical protein [Nocardioides pantholopis]|uniref:hypothetical protein n=1 Tax=Nocardioides pantholopis TaxID=2483798 RepID=UPI000F07BF66|nr:hypothetical protein [Nocardioides pantholopis]